MRKGTADGRGRENKGKWQPVNRFYQGVSFGHMVFYQIRQHEGLAPPDVGSKIPAEGSSPQPAGRRACLLLPLLALQGPAYSI